MQEPETPPKKYKRKNYAVPWKVKCTANSRSRPGDKCKAWALPNTDKCKHHGGRQQGKPRKCAEKKGGLAPRDGKGYVKVSELGRPLPEGVRPSDHEGLWVRVKDLEQALAKEQALLMGVAVVEQRIDKLIQSGQIDEPGLFDKLIAARKSIREDIKTHHEISAQEAAPAATTFNIVQYSADGPFRRVLARGLDGPVTVQYIENQPYMFDPQVNAYFAAVRQVDEDSGAEFFTRLLEALPSV